jgi:acetylornithine/N-succinyldiaminopimelate aminotransferase
MINQRSLFLQYLAQTSPSPLLLEIIKAEGVYLYDNNGKSYLDFTSGISVSSLGHGNEEVKKAIHNQTEKYLHLMVYGEIIQSPQIQLAQLLSEISPYKENTSVFYTNSGSEAIEGAMKLAKRVTGRTEIVSLQNSYHGSTHGAMSLSADTYYTDFYRPLLPGIHRMRQNNFEDLSLITEKTACVIIEPIMGEAGYIPAEQDWLIAVANRCKTYGALLVFDEIQSGLGRSGTIFGFEHYQIVPDIFVLAKAFGAGLPLGAFVSTKKLMHSLSNFPILGHITTYGGNPLCCAAAYAGLLFNIKNNLTKKAKDKEHVIRKMLSHPMYAKISGKGLMLAVELDDQETCFKIVQKSLDKGLLIDWFLYAPHKLRIAPPLIITDEEIQFACNTLNQIADEIKA